MPDETLNMNTGEAATEATLNETIDQRWTIVLRRRWWVLTAGFCISLAVVAVAIRLPDHYISQATLLVVDQEVSARYVEPESTTTVEEAAQAIKLEVLSAPRLLAIINEFGLYSSEREEAAPQLLIDRFRKDIDIETLAPLPGRQDSGGITVAFTAATPHLAQQVTSRLTSLFIDENLKRQGNQAASTEKFLTERLDAAKQRLADQEQRLQAFRVNNDGELPEQQQTNLMALANVRDRLDTVRTRLVEVQQQQSTLETTVAERLAHLQSERTELLTHFTPQYPAVTRKDAEIAAVQSILDQVRRRTPTPASKSNNTSLASDAVLSEEIRRAEANTAEIESLSKEEQSLKKEGDEYQKRLNLSPIRQQQLTQLLRDYDNYSKDYEELQKNTMQSQAVNSLQENQEGKHFQLVEPPTLPIKPSSPKRLQICLAGLAGGVIIGLILAFFVDNRDGAFYNEKTLAQNFKVPVVLSAPLVLTAAERRSRVWKIAFQWALACVMGLIMLSAEFYIYRKG
jgi:polysaccharide biosynthesis transport protein